MPKHWSLRDAKAHLGEVIGLASSDGPQIVTCRGVETAVVLSVEEYRKLQSRQASFVDMLLDGPKLDDEHVDSINRRSHDRGRKANL